MLLTVIYYVVHALQAMMDSNATQHTIASVDVRRRSVCVCVCECCRSDVLDYKVAVVRSVNGVLVKGELNLDNKWQSDDLFYIIMNGIHPHFE